MLVPQIRAGFEKLISTNLVVESNISIDVSEVVFSLSEIVHDANVILKPMKRNFLTISNLQNSELKSYG